MVIATPTALQIESKGRPLILKLDGDEVVIDSETQIFELVGSLERACWASRDGLWRARVRLGIALLELDRVLPGNTRSRNHTHFGVNARTARRAKQLARVIADDTGRIDEPKLRAAIAQYENRKRDTTGVITTETRDCDTQDSREVTGRISPEDVDLGKASLHQVEQATGLRTPKGLTTTVAAVAHDTDDHVCGGPVAPTPLGSGGDTRTHAAGPFSIAAHRHAPLTGEQATFEDLLEFTDAISRQMEDLITLDPEVLAGRIGTLGTDEAERLSEILLDLNTDNIRTGGGRSALGHPRGEG